MANGLTPEQQALVNRIKQVAAGRGASPKEVKAALETAKVEANFSNPSGGDRDSAGWRQERASLYKNPTNLTASINRFFDETHKVRGNYGSAGDLAAAVQRPAAQYRGRYQEQSGLADRLLGSSGGGGGQDMRGAGLPAAMLTRQTPGEVQPGGTGLADLIAAGLPQPQQAVASNPQTPGMLQNQYLQMGAVPEGAPPAPAAKPDATDLLSLVQPGADTPSVTTTTKLPAVPGAGLPGGAKGATGGAKSALVWAQSKIGFKETGTNSGGLASYANQKFGTKNAPWCAMFTSLAVTKGGAPSSARTASVAQVLQKAQAGNGYQRGFVRPGAAKAGDLIAFGTSHIGMVQSVSNGHIVFVAGNDSDGVQRRSVPTGQGGVRIVRPKYQ